MFQSDIENIDERWSETEEETKDNNDETARTHKDSTSTIEEKGLLYRKKELERIHQKREKYMRDNKVDILNNLSVDFSRNNNILCKSA